MVVKFLTEKEPTLELNGSKIKFGLTGDIEVNPKRHWIQDSKLSFINYPSVTRHKAIQAYALGEEVFSRFNIMEALSAEFKKAVERAERLPEENKSVVLSHLETLRVELALMNQTANAPELTAEETQAFQFKSNQIRGVLNKFITAPFVFQPNLSPEEMMKIQLENSLPGLKVDKVEYVESTPVAAETEDKVTSAVAEVVVNEDDIPTEIFQSLSVLGAK
jgi:hypothetical protein